MLHEFISLLLIFFLVQKYKKNVLRLKNENINDQFDQQKMKKNMKF